MYAPTREQLTAMLRGLCLGLASLGLACASQSPFRQDFVEVSTSNFHMTSSFGESETLAWVRDLELFHAGVLYALGLDPEQVRSRPTRVIAFDGRGAARPFAIRGAAASLIPSTDGPVLMIRAAGDFNERMTEDIRHQYAHRILRTHLRGESTPEQPRVLPLWLEEGLARLAGSTEVSGYRVRVGAVNAELRTTVLDWRQQNLERITQRKDLVGMTGPSRARFDAASWALVHSLLFADGNKKSALASLDGIRRGIEAGSAAATEKAVRGLGSGETWTSQIYTHLSKKRLRVDELQIDRRAFRDLRARPVTRAESNDRLAGLALLLRRPELAQAYFERALGEKGGPDLERTSRAGHALSLVMQEEWAAAKAALAALSGAEAPRSAAGLVRLGWAYRLWADASGAATEVPPTSEANEGAAAHIASARRAFRSALETSSDDVEARVGLAATSLRLAGDGLGASAAVLGDPAAAEPWLAEAARQAPGALALDLWQASLREHLGQRGSARRLAEGAYSRTHDLRLREEAEAFFEDGTR